MNKKHDGNKEPVTTHGGWRPGAGRKRSPFPLFTKELRATKAEQEEFLLLCPDDAREAFVLLFELLKLDRKTEEEIKNYLDSEEKKL